MKLRTMGPPDSPACLRAVGYGAVIAGLTAMALLGEVSAEGGKSSPDREAAEKWKEQLRERSRWWSLQAPKPVAPPAVTGGAWNNEPVDRFLLATMREGGLEPAAPAGPEVLLRRLSFVLTGLPPQPGRVADFVDAWERDPELACRDLVDELLDSPHFGERFARHWMDVVRYTDTYGYEWDIAAKGSWEYRDYLIRAFNRDVGFDQLIREQIAGDLLPEPRIDREAGVNESMIGPMFYHLGERRHGNSGMFNGIHQEMIDSQVDAFSKAFLAMTVACARCHDHKLDAISQRDYYALAGIFMTPRWTTRVIDAPGKHEAQIAELRGLREEIRRELARIWLEKAGRGAFRAEALLRWVAENRINAESVLHPLAKLLGENEWLQVDHFVAEASAAETTLAFEGAGRTVLASGETVPEKDTYTVRFSTPPGDVGLLRLEALTHPSLGGGGPGRTEHGNFVLSRIRVEVRPKGERGSRSVPLRAATADYEQPNYPVSAALVDSPSGWGVGLGGNVARTAQFLFAEPVSLPEGGEWTVTLDFGLGGGHSLGRFRLTPGRESTADSIGEQTLLTRWRELAGEWRMTRADRLARNTDLTILTDFSEPGFPEGWVTEGAGIQEGYVRDGTPLIALEGGRAVARILERGYHTNALSSKLPGAVRAPDPKSLPRSKARVKIGGGEWAGRNAVPQNAFLNEGLVFFDPSKPPEWMPIDTPAELSNGVTRVLTDFVTASLHPNFPPRTGVARMGAVVLPNDDDGFDKRSWFSLVGIVADDAGKAPVDTLDAFVSLYRDPEPESAEELWSRVEGWLVGTVERFAKGENTAGDVEVLNALLAAGLLPNSTEATPGLSTLVGRYREIESTIDFPRSVNGMDERGVEPIDYRLNVRGDVYDEGPRVPRDFLEVFAGHHDVRESEGSGRLELALYLASRDNPQTARVFVNRVWQWIFGTGIVDTPNDFGKLGGRPSHPELLDWLAIRFMEEGWSTKTLVRRLVLSDAFRQSGTVSRVGMERDPDNRLLHHYPTRRLEAEEIRDSLLAVSGRLDPLLHGRSIRPFRVAQDDKKRLFSGPLDGNGRRSIYLEMSIMQPPGFLVGFNLPELKSPTGRRDVTNVPAQALILLNDPFVNAMAEYWGKALVEDEKTGPEERVRSMFLSAYGREPSGEEVARWCEAVRMFSRGEGDLMRDVPAWTEIAHAFFNTKEFLYYR
ncbi:MAG: DUF1553 domain-containing protein [Verrucomicrobiae bacterium]|nr:DUF1553 domain-containing protein [Verrucomicrobiae bacterium]